MRTLSIVSLGALLLTLLAGPLVRPAAGQETAATHTVAAGETLFAIARRYGVTVADLQRLNRLEGSSIRVGQVLRVAPPGEPTGPADAAGSMPSGPARQAVSEGLSVFDVAFRLGIPPDSLFDANPDLPPIFPDGDSLDVPSRYATQTIRVRSGDTLYGIASRHGTTVAVLRSLNALRSDRLAVGQRLDVPSGSVLPERIGLPPVAAEGSITVYPDRFEGRLTASGRAYDPRAWTVAHADLDLGTVLLLTEPESGRAVFAEVADRMPARSDHVAEVSRAVADALGTDAGPVVVRVIDRPPPGGGP